MELKSFLTALLFHPLAKQVLELTLIWLKNLRLNNEGSFQWVQSCEHSPNFTAVIHPAAQQEWEQAYMPFACKSALKHAFRHFPLICRVLLSFLLCFDFLKKTVNNKYHRN